MIERALTINVRHARIGRRGAVEPWLAKSDLLQAATDFAGYLREQGHDEQAAGVEAFREMLEALA